MGGVYLRYILDTYYKNDLSILNSTLIANSLGCLIAGILYCIHLQKGSSPISSSLIIGLCGGLTTFSGFSLHAFKFLEEGLHIKSLSYIFISPLIGLFMIYIGYLLGNKLIS